MRFDALDRLMRQLRLRKPNALERTAALVARQELYEEDMDEEIWERAEERSRDLAHARQRYVRLRVESLLREPRPDSGARLRPEEPAELTEEPEDEEEPKGPSPKVMRAVWYISLVYFAAVALVLVVGMWTSVR